MAQTGPEKLDQSINNLCTQNSLFISPIQNVANVLTGQNIANYNESKTIRKANFLLLLRVSRSQRSSDNCYSVYLS